MDKGSGDGSQAAQAASKKSDFQPFVKDHADASKNEANLETLQASFDKLNLEKCDRADKTGADWDIGTEIDDGVSSEDSDIEPICSYPYGYIKRQSVYSCLTCNDPTKEDWKPAGICIGCRYACHQGHEVISMETRRNFRCDCGNKKFPESSLCILCPDKEDTNEENVYNGNYKGTFCKCNCKESECDAEDPLYQCVVCEDWYHASHCNAKTEGIEKNYTDLVCGDCTSKLDFLRYYEPFDPNAVVDDKAVNEMMKYSEIDFTDDELENGNDSNATAGEPKGDTTCKLENLTKKDPFPTGQLWTLGWRGKLCRCDKCKEMYAQLNVSFLLDKEDETRRYFSEDDEEETQDKICSLVHKFEEWLFQMDPQERTEMFQLEPHEVKEKMREYFNKTKTEDEEFIFEDHLLDQLFDSFAEFILDADGGADYLLDTDALEKVFGPGAGTSEAGKKKEVSSDKLPSNMV